MEYPITLTLAAIITIILAGVRFIIYRKIVDRKEISLGLINEEMDRLLNIAPHLANENRRDFIKNTSGLYMIERNLMDTGRYMRFVFFGSVIVLIGAFLLELFGLSVSILISTIFIVECGILLGWFAFFDLMKNLNIVEKIENGVDILEIIKSMKVGIKFR